MEHGSEKSPFDFMLTFRSNCKISLLVLHWQCWSVTVFCCR